MANATEKAKRIVGVQLADNVGKNVILLGEIKEIRDDGKTLQMETTDKTPVCISFSQPIEEPAVGYIEVYGMVLTDLTVACTTHVIFPTERSDEFESENYNALLAVFDAIDGKKWKVNKDDGGF